MVQTIRNRYVTEAPPETPAVPTQAPPTSTAPASRPVDVESFADSILAQTEDRVPDELARFIDDAASYEETQRDKMQRFARADLRARQGQFFGSPYMRAASMRVGATGGSLLARLTGNEDAANSVQRLGKAYAAEHQRLTQESTYPGVDAVARESLNVGSEMTVQSPFIALAAMTGGAAGLGTPAVITQQALTTADSAYVDALDAGKGQREAAQHAIGMGVIEGAVTGLMSTVGLGGFEKVFGPSASKPMQAGVRAALKKFGIETLSELTEEFMVQAGQSVLAWIDGVDPEAMTWDRWKQASKDITLQTVATMGVYAAPGHLAGGRKANVEEGYNPKVEQLRDKILRVAEDVALKDRGVTRNEWSEMGFSRETAKTEAERTAVTQDMAEQIQANREASAAEAPTTPVETGTGPSALDQALSLGAPEATPTAAEQAVSPEPAPVEGEPQTITTPMGEVVEAAPAPTLPVAEPGEGDLVSTANRITQQIREGLSLPGLEAEPAETQVQWVGEAQDRMAVNNVWIDRTINDIVANKRAPTPVENAGLVLHMRKLKNDINERVRLLDDVEAPDEGKAAAQTEAELLIDRLDQAIGAAEIGGTAAGRALAARKLTMNEDYDISTLLSRERVARKRPLTKEEISEVTALAKEIESLQAELAKEQAKSQERADTEGLDAAIAQAKKPRKPSQRKQASRARRKAAGAQFRQALNNLETFKPSVADFLKGETGAQIVPVELIEAGVEYVKAAVADGYVTFSEFWADSHADVGEFNNSKEVFRQAWERVREAGGIEQTSIRPDQYGEIAKYANKMLDAVVKSGVTDRKAVLAEVHDELARVVPSIDQRSVLDAITRQGNYESKTRAKTEAQKNAADVRRQLRLVQRLRQITEGKLPKGEKKSPAQVLEEVALLKKQIKEAEAKSPVLNSRKQRDVERKLRNRLLDVIDRKKKAKKPAPELEAEEKRLKEEISAAQKIGKLEDRLEAIQRGEVPGVKAKTEKGEDSPEVRRLKEQITKAEADSPAIQKAREEARKQTYEKTLQNRLDEYNRQLAENDTGVKPRKPTPESKKISDLQFEIEQAKGKVRSRREQARFEAMSRAERAWHRLKKVLHTQRTVMLSMDLPLLRQGAFYAYSHPVRAARDTLESFKAWKSDKAYFEVMEGIKARHNWKTYQEMGIDFTEMDGDFTSAEEDYAGGYLNKLAETAGVKYVAEPIKASGRGHSALMNLIRAGHADVAIEAFGGADNMTDSQKKVLGRLINVTSGRGDLGSLEKHAEAAALVFLAPRYVVSRFQQAMVLPTEAAIGSAGHDARTRAFFLKEYGKSFAGWIVISAMIQAALNFMSPEEERKMPELDTRSSAAGKVQVGNTLLDLSGGISQTSVLLSRVGWGEYKNRKGEVKPLRKPYFGEGKGPDPADYDMGDYLRDFEQYKFAPWLSFTIDLATRETGGGFEDLTAVNLAKNYLVPIPVVDVVKSTEDLGIPRAIVVNAVMEAGSGMQTYDEKAKQKGVVPNPFATE